jgi:hypothetical protein
MNDYGQLGTGDRVDGPTPRLVRALTGVTSLALGEFHGCALMGDPLSGTLRCWGSNMAGQLGDGTTTDRLEPVAIDW